MSERVRIYQLAKELDVESKVVLEALDSLGIAYKSHASTLDAETAENVRDLALQDLAKTPTINDSPDLPTEVEKPSVENDSSGAATTDTSPPPPAPDAPIRAPVVTIMGHVDHGKTSLLDYIRKTAVAEREAGGITQHIGAYQTETNHGIITFLDTPGHEAFTSIRQRGANVTDIVVIVIAADDSIMPQTREAIAHAQAAQVPIIIAINKTDLPQANPAKVKQDLIQFELVPEEFGGDTITVEISAQTGSGIDSLLEMISLVAEVEDLRADPQTTAYGVVIESILDKRAGVLATVLVQQGTLRVADTVVSGETWARIRRLTDHNGGSIDQAGPSVPVQILGFNTQPQAGDSVSWVENDRTAKDITANIQRDREIESRIDSGKTGITIEDLFQTVNVTTIKMIVRTDTQGSLEAIKNIISQLSESTEEVDVQILLAEVGSPTDSDLLLASTADAHVVAFGVNPAGSVKKAAHRQGVNLKSYRIVYDLIEDIERLIHGQIEPEFEEQTIGQAEVRAVIQIPRSGSIAGSYVNDGLIRRGAKARVTRDGREVYKGSISQLRRFKDDVREVTQGLECGINLQNYENIQEGDVIHVYELVEVSG